MVAHRAPSLAQQLRCVFSVPKHRIFAGFAAIFETCQ
jgi:hypothetical protein